MTSPKYHRIAPAVSREAGALVNSYRLLIAGASEGKYVQGTNGTAPILGVSALDGAAADGDVLDVEHVGMVPVTCGDDVPFGSPVTADASGRAVVAQPGEYYGGFLLETGSVDAICEMLVAPGLLYLDTTA